MSDEATVEAYRVFRQLESWHAQLEAMARSAKPVTHILTDRREVSAHGLMEAYCGRWVNPDEESWPKAGRPWCWRCQVRFEQDHA